MPKNLLFIHELTDNHQQSISDYIQNFYKEEYFEYFSPKSKKNIWKNILKEKNITQVFDELNKINPELGLLFIKNFPREPIISGNKMLKHLYITVLKDLDISGKQLVKTNNELQNKWKCMKNRNLEDISKQINKNKDTFKDNKEVNININKLFIDIVKNYYDEFYDNLNYCKPYLNIKTRGELSDFMICEFGLKLFDILNEKVPKNKKKTELMHEYCVKALENIKDDIIKEYKEKLKCEPDKKIFKVVTERFKDLEKKIKTKDSDFQYEMKKELLNYNSNLMKHYNFFATNGVNRIYKENLPNIYFSYLHAKQEVIDFYYKNQDFLDKNIDLKNKLFDLENGLSKTKKFDEYCATVRENTRYKSFMTNWLSWIWQSKFTEHELYYMELQNIIKSSEKERSTEEQFFNHFKLNFIQNKILNDLSTKLENFPVNEENEAKPIESPQNKQESMSDTNKNKSYELPKEKIKTKGQTDITKLNINDTISWKKQEKFKKKLKIIDRIEKKLKIIDRIEKQEKFEKNNQIINEMYEICFNSISNISDKNMNQLSILSSNLISTQTKYYDDNTLSATNLPKQQQQDNELYKTKPKAKKYYPFMVYNLKRSIEQDKENGRPAIYLDYDKDQKQHILIYGTSVNKNDKEKILTLKLEKKTYFYSENIIFIKDEDIGEHLNDFWSRDETNKPIEFVNLVEQENLGFKVKNISKEKSYPLQAKSCSQVSWRQGGYDKTTISTISPKQSDNTKVKDPTGMNDYLNDYQNLQVIGSIPSEYLQEASSSTVSQLSTNIKQQELNPWATANPATSKTDYPPFTKGECQEVQNSQQEMFNLNPSAEKFQHQQENNDKLMKRKDKGYGMS